MISARYAPLTCALLGLALIPTFIHSYSESTVSDGRTASSIPATLSGYTSRPAALHNDTWGQRQFDSFDWVERIYETASDSVTLTVVRTYDPKSVYHHPELAVTKAHFDKKDIATLAEAPDMPIHVLRGDAADEPIGLYVLHYDGRFIADPIRFQLRTAGELLFSRRKAMTLFFVIDSAPSTEDVSELAAAKLLLDAVNAFASPAAEPGLPSRQQP